MLTVWADAVDVHIESDMDPTKCLVSEVAHTLGDQKLCIQSAQVDELARINAEQSKRQISTRDCLVGFVRRSVADNICVSIDEKATVDNIAHAQQQRNGLYSEPTYGLNACKPGFVWRSVDVYDYVCINAGQLAVIQQQNVDSALHTTSSACVSGFQWRMATAVDKVCVSEADAQQARRDYLALEHRLRLWAFFNGGDHVFLINNDAIINRPNLL
jgi:hypothetical protein